MRAPNIAYQFTAPTDTAGPTIELVNRTVQISGGAGDELELLQLEVPKDRIFILSNVTMDTNPGAAQIVEVMRVEGRTQTGFLFGIANEEFQLAADDQASLNWQGEVWIPGGGQKTTTLRFFARFNASVVANFLRAEYSGIVIPRGNAGAF